MPSQIFAPVPVAASKHKGLKLLTSADLLASLHATLETSSAVSYGSGGSPFGSEASFYGISEDDYTVPAPPPPSPVSFRNEHWPLTMSAANKSSVAPACH